MTHWTYGMPLPGSTAWAAEQIQRILERDIAQPAASQHLRIPDTNNGPVRSSLPLRADFQVPSMARFNAMTMPLANRFPDSMNVTSSQPAQAGLLHLAAGGKSGRPFSPRSLPPGFTMNELLQLGAGLTGKPGETAMMHWLNLVRLQALQEQLARTGEKEKERRRRCDEQALEDEATCRGLRSPAVRARCWASVQERYGACVTSKPLPPLVTE